MSKIVKHNGVVYPDPSVEPFQKRQRVGERREARPYLVLRA